MATTKKAAARKAKPSDNPLRIKIGEGIGGGGGGGGAAEPVKPPVFKFKNMKIVRTREAQRDSTRRHLAIALRHIGVAASLIAKGVNKDRS